MPDIVYLAMDYCLAEGTRIITTSGIVPIEDVGVGMGVVSCTNGKSLQLGRVEKAAYIGTLPSVRIHTTEGESVDCTPDHTWMKYSGVMVRTSELVPGDRLAHVKNGYSGRYPTWYIRGYCNYIKKHTSVCTFLHGDTPKGCDVDHRDGDIMNWKGDNLRHLDTSVNRAQGGRRYWAEVKSGDRDDSVRLNALRVGLKSRRSYKGSGNPNYGKRRGAMNKCPGCGISFYTYPSQIKRYYTAACHKSTRTANHRVKEITHGPPMRMYQITVEGVHNYSLENGMVSGNSQIELRVAAHESQDPVMMGVYHSDGDIHMETATGIFHLPEAEIDDKRHRRPAKTVNFGVIYGITPGGLLTRFYAEDIFDFTAADCYGFIRSWEEKYTGYFEWAERTKSFARRNGYVVDMFARRRYVPEVYSSLEWIVEGGLREAVNAPIQSGAGGILKEAMVQLTPLYQGYQAAGRHVKPVLQIHDELLWEVEYCLLDEVVLLFGDVMVNAVSLSVPVKVDAEWGYNWKDMQDITVPF